MVRRVAILGSCFFVACVSVENVVTPPAGGVDAGGERPDGAASAVDAPDAARVEASTVPSPDSGEDATDGALDAATDADAKAGVSCVDAIAVGSETFPEAVAVRNKDSSGDFFPCSGPDFTPSQYTAKCALAIQALGGKVQPDGSTYYEPASCRVPVPADCSRCARGKTEW